MDENGGIMAFTTSGARARGRFGAGAILLAAIVGSCVFLVVVGVRARGWAPRSSAEVGRVDRIAPPVEPTSETRPASIRAAEQRTPSVQPRLGGLETPAAADP